MFNCFYLLCAGCKQHLWLPCPSYLETLSDLQETPSVSKQAVLACPKCGLVCAYSAQGIACDMFAKLSPILDGTCVLVAIDADCEGTGCEAASLLYEYEGTVEASWKVEIARSDWKWDDSARCEQGHKLTVHPEAGMYRGSVANPF